VRLNLLSAEKAMKYNSDIPNFLINRPRNVVKHCFKRWEESRNISADSIDHCGEGQFVIKSQVPDNPQVYCVCFSSSEFPVPSCDCMDWAKHHLPCKHFCAIFRNVPEWNWDKIPEKYRNNPFITLDDDVLCAFNDQPTEDGEPTMPLELEKKSKTDCKPVEIPIRINSRRSKLQSEINNYCQMITESSFSCKDVGILHTISTILHGTLDHFKAELCGGNILVPDDPKKQMIHNATTPAKKVKSLSLSKRRNKGVGRSGSSAERMRKHTSKSVYDLLPPLNGELNELNFLLMIAEDHYVFINMITLDFFFHYRQ
jgi:hypothetical protein